MEPLAHKQRKYSYVVLSIAAVGIMALALVLACFNAVLPPKNFTSGYVVIPPGSTVRQSTDILYASHIIRSPKLFELFFEHSNGASIFSGEYSFTQPQSLRTIFYRVTHGYFGVREVRVTIPEGFTRTQIATLLSGVLPQFSVSEFLAKTKEGYLFPDTYQFSSRAHTSDIIEKLQDTWTKKAYPVVTGMSSSLSASDIVILASIVEKEAKGSDDRAFIAGILENRLTKHIPLQVDASVAYGLHKDGDELTRNDLQTDTLYNTYLHKGLPPTPISNPGLLAIQAVLHPETSDYLYYLHDKDGIAHYAKTFAEHRQNIIRYLK
jgi:UPF0755 protein